MFERQLVGDTVDYGKSEVVELDTTLIKILLTLKSSRND